MAVDIVMPKLAMAMKQGKIAEWKAQEGQWVEKGRIVMVIETEKVTYEVEASASGYLHIITELDTAVPVNETVAFLSATQEELAELQAARPAPEMPQLKEAAAAAAASTASAGFQKKAKVRISPAAKKLAQKHDLDITRITGSAPGGRIKKEDVLKFLESGEAIVAAAAPSEEAWTAEMVDGKRVKAAIPMKGMRKAIADHMIQSLSVSAQLSSMGEVDMTELIQIRKSLLQKEAEIGVRITYTDLMILALTKAVQNVPLVNSSLIEDEIKIWEDINVAVAVALDRGEYESGLIVPVIKNADKKSLAEISRCIKDLTARARSAELTPDDLYGGTITLSNVGGLAAGWAVSTPILNQPQAVIVQPGGILDRPVARDGQVVVRPIMTLSVTFDHRILDGVPIIKFFTKMVELLENPELLLL